MKMICVAPESVLAFAVCQLHLLDSPPLINGWYSEIKTCCYGVEIYKQDSTLDVINNVV